MALHRKTITSLCGNENISLFSTLPSTNDCLKALARQGAPDGTVVLADAQTAGKGRLGRTFHSPAGKGLYLSYLWRPQEMHAEQLLPLTGLCAVAAMRAAEESHGVKPQIKWTNDLVFGGRKLGGILTEMLLRPGGDLADAVILGIGINVHHAQSDFPEEVRDMATSLALCGVKGASRDVLAAALIRELAAAVGALTSGSIADYIASYRTACLTLGKRVRLVRGEEESFALAADIDGQFGLCVRYDDGTEAVIRSGEASVRGLYGYLE